MTWRSISGHDLAGDNLVRLVFLDESGTGKIENDPFCVVAGVIVNADKQLRKLERHLSGIIEKYIPSENREGFCFHAHEIYHGRGIFDKGKISRSERLEILRELCFIPKMFDLPVVMASFDRRKGFVSTVSMAIAGNWEKAAELQMKHSLSSNPKDRILAYLTEASTLCFLQIEKFMQSLSDQDEVASLVYENNPQVKEVIRHTHNWMLNPGCVVEKINEQLSNYIHITKIIEAPLFSEKHESRLLQLADAIAFATKRKLSNYPDADIYFAPIKSQLVIHRLPSPPELPPFSDETTLS